MKRSHWTALMLCSVSLACQPADEPVSLESTAAAEFTFRAPEIEVVGTAEDGLDRPRDLAFNPDGSGELWVVNQAAPYRPSDVYPWVVPPEGADCLPGKGRDTTDPSYWSSTTTFFDVGTDVQRSEHVIDTWSSHFLAEASSIAFGARHRPHPLGGPSEPGEAGPRTFATCGESRNEFKGCRAQNDFMGPALWTTDPETYGKTNPLAVEALAKLHCDEDDPDYETCRARIDLGSHLDMLHESPNCMGVAWEGNTNYWVFDGCGGSQWVPPPGSSGRVTAHDPGTSAPDDPAIAACKPLGDIVRYDFQTDHGRGFDNHCDGVIERVAVGVVKYVEGVPSHLEYDESSKLLFIADSGQNRVLALDTGTGTTRGDLQTPPRENEGDACTAHYLMREGAQIEVLVDGAEANSPMKRPSGLAFWGEDVLFVGDNQTGHIHAISRLGRKILASLDMNLPDGALMGLATSTDGYLYAVDSTGNRVLRVKVPEALSQLEF